MVFDQYRRTIAVLVGAGASLSDNAPSTNELTNIIINALPEFVVQMPNERHLSQISFRSAFISKLKAAKVEEPTFEDIIAAAEELLDFDPSYGPNIGCFVRPRADSEALFHHLTLTMALTDMYNSVIRTFLMRLPSGEDYSRASINSLLRRLAKQSRIVLATLNYDNLLDDSINFDDGYVKKFDNTYKEFFPGSWMKSAGLKKSHLLMHVHGNMRFGYRNANDLKVHLPFSEPVLYESVEDAAATTLRQSVSSAHADGRTLSSMPFIAGALKASKITHNVRPFSYYSTTALQEFASADALLLVGYSFADAHANAWIDEFLRSKPQGRVVLITHRTGEEIGSGGDHKPASQREKFIHRLAGNNLKVDNVYVSSDGTNPIANRMDFGRFYLEAAGIPLSPDSVTAIANFLE